MPRKNPLPATEAAICERLLQARRTLRLSRVAFAQEAGIDSSQLRRYEHAFAPVRARDAVAICRVHSIGLPWLATGLYDPGQSPMLPKELADVEISERLLFSRFFEDTLNPALVKATADARAWVEFLSSDLQEIAKSLKAPAALPRTRQTERIIRDLVKKMRKLEAEIGKNLRTREKLSKLKRAPK